MCLSWAPRAVPGVAVPGAGGNGMYMGRAVDPNPGPAWSAGHRGLCLYVSRLLAPVYDKKVAVAAGGKTDGSGRVLTCRFSTRTLEVGAGRDARRRLRLWGGGRDAGFSCIFARCVIQHSLPLPFLVTPNPNLALRF